MSQDSSRAAHSVGGNGQEEEQEVVAIRGWPAPETARQPGTYHELVGEPLTLTVELDAGLLRGAFSVTFHKLRLWTVKEDGSVGPRTVHACVAGQMVYCELAAQWLATVESEWPPWKWAKFAATDKGGKLTCVGTLKLLGDTDHLVPFLRVKYPWAMAAKGSTSYQLGRPHWCVELHLIKDFLEATMHKAKAFCGLIKALMEAARSSTGLQEWLEEEPQAELPHDLELLLRDLETESLRSPTGVRKEGAQDRPMPGPQSKPKVGSRTGPMPGPQSKPKAGSRTGPKGRSEAKPTGPDLRAQPGCLEAAVTAAVEAEKGKWEAKLGEFFALMDIGIKAAHAAPGTSRPAKKKRRIPRKPNVHDPKGKHPAPLSEEEDEADEGEERREGRRTAKVADRAAKEAKADKKAKAKAEVDQRKAATEARMAKAAAAEATQVARTAAEEAKAKAAQAAAELAKAEMECMEAAAEAAQSAAELAKAEMECMEAAAEVAKAHTRARVEAGAADAGQAAKQKRKATTQGLEQERTMNSAFCTKVSVVKGPAANNAKGKPAKPAKNAKGKPAKPAKPTKPATAKSTEEGSEESKAQWARASPPLSLAQGVT